MQEREFQNMFTFATGFEAAILKIPSNTNENEEYYGRKQIVRLFLYFISWPDLRRLGLQSFGRGQKRWTPRISSLERKSTWNATASWKQRYDLHLYNQLIFSAVCKEESAQ